jgi:hypothetical protein
MEPDLMKTNLQIIAIAIVLASFSLASHLLIYQAGVRHGRTELRLETQIEFYHEEEQPIKQERKMQL